MKHIRLFFPFFVGVLLAQLILPSKLSVNAQTEEPDTPFYIVQEGDSLWDIAARFGVLVEDLQAANQLSDPGQLVVGLSLTIPGLDGFAGQVDTYEVAYGETLQSLSHGLGISQAVLVRLNKLVSPGQVYAGALLVVPVIGESPLQGRVGLGSGGTLLELAVQLNENPWTLASDNERKNMSAVLPGTVLQTRQPGGVGVQGVNALPTVFSAVEIYPLPIAQGKTVVLRVNGPAEMVLHGTLAGRELNFFREGEDFIALQGIHTQTGPGLYPLSLEGEWANGEHVVFSQMIFVRPTDYIFDPPLTVDPTTVDPSVTGPETELWDSLSATVTPDKQWEGQFVGPVPLDLINCWPSVFGNRRSYNGSSYDFFHGGLDFCGTVGTELYAAAAGHVTYTGSLTIHGQVVVIDHGWGVYTSYAHLSQILVQPGDMVQAGQLVGLGGDTGRTTGPHLHWEVWVGGVQVDPLDWLERTFP